MSKGLFLVRMDVAHDHEATFNEVYDTEHVPNLAKVPGVQRASRFKAAVAHRAPLRGCLRAGRPRHRRERGLQDGGRAGALAHRGAPAHDEPTPRDLRMGGGAKALTGKTPYVFWVMMDIEPHREALFNELYDTEHLPLLMKLPAR
jgi:hypothetical protein